MLFLYLPESSGFSCEFDTTSGDFSSDFAVVIQDDIYVSGNVDAKLYFDTTSGDVTIKKK